MGILPHLVDIFIASHFGVFWSLLRILVHLDVEQEVNRAFKHFKKERPCRQLRTLAEKFGRDETVDKNGGVFGGPNYKDRDALQIVNIDVPFGLA